jgi:predicted dehydrogenase
MWTRFTPAMMQVKQWLADGEIGDVRVARANFSFRTNFNPEGRLFKVELGGGALLDAGIYPISFAYMVLGSPKSVNSSAMFGETGVDEHSTYYFTYEGGAAAFLQSGTRVHVPVDADIIGTEGYIKIHEPFLNPRVLTLAKLTQPGVEGQLIFEGNKFDTQTFHVPTKGIGYNYEAIEVGECIRAGKLESAGMTLADSLDIMEKMDAIRAEWGLTYPNE